MAAAAGSERYSCESAARTLEWMDAVAGFLRRFRHLLDAHVVNFFKDRLWETVDLQWMECLRKEPVENLFGIPSGLVLEHWPASLQEFIMTVRSLILPREPGLSNTKFSDLHVTELGSVLSQGMNIKKKHEVEVLSAVVSRIANDVGAQTIMDVGSGQGYLAQVLSFQYQLSVIALDASSHNATVTSARAERIKKHYAAKMQKSHYGSRHLFVPQTVTFHVLSSSTLTALSTTLLHRDATEKLREIETELVRIVLESSKAGNREQRSCSDQHAGSSVVLAGLHACGNLSVNMLRTFVECEQVKAVACIGCCYNLLSEECFEKIGSPCGYPLSNGAKLSGLTLGKNARDLACQSAERWRNLTKDSAQKNFELHAFRAAFQMVLDKYHPEVLISSPSIGRQGKALRRRQLRRDIHSKLDAKESTKFSAITAEEHRNKEASLLSMEGGKVEVIDGHHRDVAQKDDLCIIPDMHAMMNKDYCCCTESEEISSGRRDKFVPFEEFSKSGLGRLGFQPSQDIDFLEIWEQTQPFSELVGPYWSLRAALGPLVETYLLLDRLLFLQEQGSKIEAMMFPLFDPTLSPRNVAIIAQRK